MTVAELIEKLKAMPQDAKAIVSHCAFYGMFSDSNIDGVKVNDWGEAEMVLGEEIRGD